MADEVVVVVVVHVDPVVAAMYQIEADSIVLVVVERVTEASGAGVVAVSCF